MNEEKISKYELTFIVSTDIPEDEREKVITRFRDFATGFKAEIFKEHVWGQRRMSYRIKGQDYGLYVTFLLTMPANKIEELKHEFNLDPQILRYLVISLDKEGLEFEDVSVFPELKDPNAPVEPEVEEVAATEEEVAAAEETETVVEEAAPEEAETPEEVVTETPEEPTTEENTPEA